MDDATSSISLDGPPRGGFRSRALSTMGRMHGSAVHGRRIRKLAEHFTALIPQRHSVLDVGCGDGVLDALILAHRPDLSIVGVDVLVRPDTAIPVTPFDGRRLPFEDKAFDTILFCDVLHHTASPVEMLAEAVRVARRGVAIKDHTVQGWLARPLLRFMDFVGNAPHGVVLPYNYLKPEEWTGAFRACGLSREAIIQRLCLYPPGFDAIFGRSLHFAGYFGIEG